MIHIYDCNETFLYEVIEDYKEAENNEVKDEIFNSFCSSLWASDNKRRTYIKTIHFKVRKDLLDTELGRVFDTWSGIEYRYYKSMTKDENWCAIIRQKINNIYTRYFDKEVILNKEYMDLLKKPKLMYFDWLSGTEMDANTVTDIIDNAIDESEKLKQRFQMEKMTLSWNEYKKVVEGFLRRCFDNCKLIEEYENKTQIINNYDFITEDNFYVKYINRSLNAYFQNYQKDYYSVKRGHNNKYSRCKRCGGIIEKTGNKRLYCDDCRKQNDLERYKKYNKKRITTNRKFEFSL
nr:MAG TPA: RNA polymerase subunit [Bacteriophage sp.]